MRTHIIKILLSVAFFFGCGDHNKQYSPDSRKENSPSTDRFKSSEPLVNKEDVPEDQSEETEDKSEGTDKYPDDIYCADVEYYNPNTESHSSYTLTVQVEDHEITEIHWPNGGRSHDDDFSSGEIEDDGSASISLDNGIEYEIQIIGKGRNCFINVPKASQCSGITKKGDRCRNLTDNLNGHCWTHQNQNRENSSEPLSDEEEDTDENDQNN